MIAGEIEAVYERVLAGKPRTEFEELDGEPDECIYRKNPHLL